MTFEGLGTGTGIENSIPKVQERESEAIIPGNGREWEREWNEKIRMIRTD